MVCQTTGVPEKFGGVPAGSRAIQLWDSKVPHYFLKLFGRPVRISACECERVHEPERCPGAALAQLAGDPRQAGHDGGTVARLAARRRRTTRRWWRNCI